MVKKSLNEAGYKRLMKNPERRFSLAAAVLTENWLAGILIEIIAVRGGKPFSYKEMADMTFCSYTQCRLAIEKLEQAELITVWTQKQTYIYNVDAGRPERTPLRYLLTEKGQECVAGTLKQKAEAEEENLPKYVESPDEELKKGEAIASRCGLIVGGRLNLSNYKLKTEFLTDTDLTLLKTYIDKKKQEG